MNQQSQLSIQDSLLIQILAGNVLILTDLLFIMVKLTQLRVMPTECFQEKRQCIRNILNQRWQRLHLL